MSSAFQESILRAIDNPGLQIALDANAERRINAIQAARASLPEPWEVMRRRAHAVRAAVIEKLDENLDTFIRNAQANGIQVHRAADAEEANRIVLEIAAKNNIELVAKSKTMVSEEIGLNHVLEAAGIDVVETDLGEYIVQLRGERPAHIITPAVHLRRSDVGQTFHEKLGIPLTDDIPTLTAEARSRLRNIFLQAGMGVSGVNFGVIENGALCIVTNEGNAGMVTTLPRIHVALMGIERMVPGMDELALMLYLLPRSATGQKMTVYTSLIRAPRQTEEADGPQERHLILVDNGRRRMRNSALKDALMCIRCGACLNACPIFREISGHAYVDPQGNSSTYPGPIGSIVSPALFGQDQFGYLARASSLCGACKEVCPVDIDLPKLLLRVRAGFTPEVNTTAENASIAPQRPNAPVLMTIALRLYAWTARSPWRFRMAQQAAALFARLISPRSEWMRLPAFTGWGLSKDFPRPARNTFRQRFIQQSGRTQPQSVSEQGEHTTNRPAETSPPDVPLKPQAARSPRTCFEEELIALGGSFTVCTPQTLAKEIRNVLQAGGHNRIIAWEDGNFPPGLLKELDTAGIEVTHTPDPTIQAGLTGCTAGIAESGGVLLCNGPGRPRSASLTTELHLVVMKTTDIYAHLTQVLDMEEVRQASTSVIVCGPSRTADIEMTLSIGVHGPGRVHVFCLE